MTFEQIVALPVKEIVADDAHLYLWVTNAKLCDHDYGSLMRAWGFVYKTCLTWRKTNCLGIGHYFRGETEHVYFGTRGSAGIPPELRQRNFFEAPRGQHSAKPDVFLDLVELVSPAPRIELFSRRARFGWDTWGDQALHGTDLLGLSA